MAFTKVVKEEGNVVMVGKMGYWETKLILTPKEALGLAKAMALPLLRAVLKF